MQNKIQLSVFIPAFNEEQNIDSAVESIISLLKDETSALEILVVDDGSTDRTYSKLQKLSKKYKNLRYFHNESNLGIGKSFQNIINEAKNKYITVFPGDNDMSPNSLLDLIHNAHRADLVTSFMEDNQVRAWYRTVLSRLFVKILNTVLGLSLKYYNGPFICKVENIKKITLQSNGYAIFAEMKAKMLIQGSSYLEIPFRHIGRKHGVSKALTIKSLFETANTLLVLVFAKLHN